MRGWREGDYQPSLIVGAIMPHKLPPDATLGHLVLDKAEAERFVRRVLGVMHQAAKDHGEIFMRLGVTGTGIAPNYRLEGPDQRPIMPIDGANHEVWPAGVKFDGAENWSTMRMSQDDVRATLASLTGHKS